MNAIRQLIYIKLLSKKGYNKFTISEAVNVIQYLALEKSEFKSYLYHLLTE